MKIEINVPERLNGYEAYRLVWMLEHGHSLSELIYELRDYQYDDPEDADQVSMPVTGLFESWEADRGFGGELWCCESEYHNSEESCCF
jgi:hypothetical protein